VSRVDKWRIAAYQKLSMIDRDDARLTSARVRCVALIAPCGNRVAAAEWRTRAACDVNDPIARDARIATRAFESAEDRRVFPDDRARFALKVKVSAIRITHAFTAATSALTMTRRDVGMRILWFRHITDLIPVQMLMVNQIPYNTTIVLFEYIRVN